MAVNSNNSHENYGSFESVKVLNTNRTGPNNSVITPSCQIEGYQIEISMIAGNGDNKSLEESPTHMHGNSSQDVHQRQPLLPYDTDPSRWEVSDLSDSYNTANVQYFSNGINERKQTVALNLPLGHRKEDLFPDEKIKTFLSFLFVCFNCTLNMTSLAIIHDKVPDRDKYPPLPDVVLDNITAVDWALDLSEYLIMASMYSCILVIVFHKHRWILFRRVFFLMGLLYLMRTITVFVTVLPVASTTYYCQPKANVTTVSVVAHRVWQLVTGLGLSVNGRHTYCGDYIYSGHTVVLTMAYLVLQEYTPKNFVWIHWISWAVSVTGVCMLLYARGHYTIDVILAYYVTTRLFWTYHTLANNSILKTKNPNNFISCAWWYFLFMYFEKNVKGVVPRRYEWPFPWPFTWPCRCRRKRPDRDS